MLCFAIAEVASEDALEKHLVVADREQIDAQGDAVVVGVLPVDDREGAEYVNGAGLADRQARLAGGVAEGEGLFDECLGSHGCCQDIAMACQTEV